MRKRADPQAIAEQRRRFYEARAAGLSIEAAAALANGSPSAGDATATQLTGGGAVDDPRDAVAIPDDWEAVFTWQQLRKTAAAVSDEKINNAEDAKRAILVELERRAAKAAAPAAT